MNNKLILAIIILVLIIAGVWYYQNGKATDVVGEPIKIGVITDLTGPAAYWGESARVGAELAEQELEQDGLSVELVFEDYQLEAPRAASAVQKLLNLDQVDALYVEFNPGAIAASSVAKSANKLFIYDAAVTSILKDSPYFYKTYLDYEAGCEAVAQKFKERGVVKMGVLKVNMEAGDLCLAGVNKVFSGNDLVVDSYNLGDTDFRTQLLKISNSGAEAVINSAFEGDTFNTLKVVRDLKYNLKYGTVADTVSETVLAQFGEQLKGGFAFGFPPVDDDFKRKVDQKAGSEVPSYYAAALAYTHIKQIAEVVSQCANDLGCTKKEMAKLKDNKTIQFKKFNGQIAELETTVISY